MININFLIILLFFLTKTPSSIPVDVLEFIQ